MTAPRVMFYVQHLLGIGHVKRAAAISRALAEAGLPTTVVSGGAHVAGADFGAVRTIRLPPIHAADARFAELLDESGNPVGDAYRERRRRALLDAFAAVRPDVLAVELFPFGRWQFRFELLPLLEAAGRARPRPRVVSSVRDVLVHKARPERNREMAELARAWFDLVLVHGDPAVVRLEESFPEAALVSERIRYTGYVADGGGEVSSSAAGAGEVIVSVGGGAVGGPLLRTALQARPLGGLGNAPWRLLAGPNTPAPVLAEIAAAAPPGVAVEPARPDFPALLRNCRLSISQAGYNTLMDVVHARARAVVVPFAAGQETEQAFRARLFEARGLVSVLAEDRLSPQSLAHAADRAAARARPAAGALDVDGARATARFVAEVAAGPAPNIRAQ